MEFLIVVFVLMGCFSSCFGSALSPSRLCVIENRVGSRGTGLSQRMLAFRSCATPVSVQVSYRDTDGSSNSTRWSPWKTLGAPLASQPLSNPVCVYTERNQTQIFVQASDGQVYTSIQDTADFLNFSTWKKVGSNPIPASGPKRSLLVDSVSVVRYGKQLIVFARSISTTASRLYWCKGIPTSCKWGLVAGSTTLGTDATIIKNTYTTKYEAFMISRTGKMHRSWQHASGNSFAAWKAMASSPTFSTISRPVAQIMGYNSFNGKIMIGAIGKDNFVHRCAQATCDTVDNPWSYCTWGNWHQTGGKIPFAQGGVQNNLAMSRTVHFGVEIFTVEETDGQLWQAWQPKRDTSWNTWSKIEQDLKMAAFINNPFIRLNEAGWWMAYGLSAQDKVIVVEASRSMSIKQNKVSWSKNLIVSWSLSKDEASNMDWVGVFLPGATNNQYLDYRYVQGGLNPGKNPVMVGKLSMIPYLPDGSYQVRYLVNRKFISVMETDVSFYNESRESDLLQLFRGLYIGLGITTVDVTECVDEAQQTVKLFEDCFFAFEKGQVFQGLQLLGTALEDLALTLIRCKMTLIVQPLLQFIKDLLKCVYGNCMNFIIEMTEMLTILFQKRYEIYGDIRSAANSFKLAHAHQQGGLCIGRLVKACLEIEDSLLSNGSMPIPEINGTLGREEMMLYGTGRKGALELIDTGRKEGAKLMHTVKREALELTDTSRREAAKLIDTGRKEGAKLMHTVKREAMELTDTSRREAAKLIDTGRKEVMKLIDTGREVGAKLIGTGRGEGMKLIDTGREMGAKLIGSGRK